MLNALLRIMLCIHLITTYFDVLLRELNICLCKLNLTHHICKVTFSEAGGRANHISTLEDQTTLQNVLVRRLLLS